MGIHCTLEISPALAELKAMKSDKEYACIKKIISGNRKSRRGRLAQMVECSLRKIRLLRFSGDRVWFSTRIFSDASMQFISDFESSKNAIPHATYQIIGNEETAVKSFTIWVKGNIARINRSFIHYYAKPTLQPTTIPAYSSTYGGAQALIGR